MGSLVGASGIGINVASGHIGGEARGKENIGTLICSLLNPKRNRPSGPLCHLTSSGQGLNRGVTGIANDFVR